MFLLDQKIAIVEKKISEDLLELKKRDSGAWSEMWLTFNEIYENDCRLPFVICTLCKCVLYKPTSNTNIMIRHKCDAQKSIKKVNILPIDVSRLKFAAAKFVAKDIRPIWAPTCEGLLDLCVTCMEFGQTYPKAIRSDLLRVMPSRNTVRNEVNEIAASNREKIGVLLRKALETGGISASTDCWQDNYRKISYLAVVAHLTIDDNGISRYRFVLSTSEITEMRKTGNNLKILNFNKGFLIISLI